MVHLSSKDWRRFGGTFVGQTHPAGDKQAWVAQNEIDKVASGDLRLQQPSTGITNPSINQSKYQSTNESINQPSTESSSIFTTCMFIHAKLVDIPWPETIISFFPFGQWMSMVQFKKTSFPIPMQSLFLKFCAHQMAVFIYRCDMTPLRESLD